MAHSWEQAVRILRSDPSRVAEVRDNHFDLPVAAAARRYADGEEFAEVARILVPSGSRRLLDFGAGNGVASYALARLGWNVTSVEPDASTEVGAGAIRALAAETGAQVEVVESGALPLPFADGYFDAVHVRQALHHVPDLDAAVGELKRVVRRGGALLVTREHVLSTPEDLPVFLARHPLHKYYGGENAYTLARYRHAFEGAGLRLVQLWGPFESILNYFPGTEAQRRHALSRALRGAGSVLRHVPGFPRLLGRYLSSRDRSPGRLYSFYAVRP